MAERMLEVSRLALEALALAEVEGKLEAVDGLAALDAGACARWVARPALGPEAIPGRPRRPELVPPRELERRGLGTARGRAALLHAVAHIEFNAVNLALDAASRFSGLPADFYRDWISVAVDEARHFRLLRARLRELGCDYGDFPAHDGLWTMAVSTRHSLLERMALVPRVLEARGLDVSPGMIERLLRAGDEASAEILRVILAEEVRHVALGTRWFHFACRRAGKEPRATFLALLDQHLPGALRGPLNLGARAAAGFDAEELALLEARC